MANMTEREKQARREATKKYQRTHKTEVNKRHRRYHHTIIGHLRNCYHQAKQRCNNPNHPRYKDWGGRGIKCQFKDADDFIEHILNDLEIDRIDNNGHYERGNIRLTTAKENCNNRRKSK